ncbi:hypothetical protein Sarmat_00124 [Rickettsiales endosymbiont of Paramecium tredecaurelia]|uniref:hypothetical protein n=1 Tax=Candidatus Sarmatiella mevalonica TaxID=2770581 RepID=UPI00192140F7|nr:hypothetical protein [Candidatus Sarmatiella mevalonica]MBL3284284.1 hypothetical protein [Candidatus Sarmatiella mevalonica]
MAATVLQIDVTQAVNDLNETKAKMSANDVATQIAKAMLDAIIQLIQSLGR